MEQFTFSVGPIEPANFLPSLSTHQHTNPFLLHCFGSNSPSEVHWGTYPLPALSLTESISDNVFWWKHSKKANKLLNVSYAIKILIIQGTFLVQWENTMLYKEFFASYLRRVIKFKNTRKTMGYPLYRMH